MLNEFENGETKVFFLGFLEKQDSQNSVVTLFYKGLYGNFSLGIGVSGSFVKKNPAVLLSRIL